MLGPLATVASSAPMPSRSRCARTNSGTVWPCGRCARPTCYTARMRTDAEIHEQLTKLRADLALLQEERRQLEQQIATPEWARRSPSLETQLAIVRRLIYTLEWVLNEHD